MKYAIFSSIGYSTNLLDYCIQKLDHCDLFVNFFGDDQELLDKIYQYSKFVSTIKTTKFPSLKKIYDLCDINQYDYVFVYDDDCIVESGDILSIPLIMKKYNLDIGSPCHSNNGIVSHNVMRFNDGNHIFRYTNFIEMNFPVFSKDALQKYMLAYDGQLCGWGNDWWYLNVLESNIKKNSGIIDSVCVKNPLYHEKNYKSINNFMPRENRRLEWEKLRHNMKLHEWSQKTLDFIYE